MMTLLKYLKAEIWKRSCPEGPWWADRPTTSGRKWYGCGLVKLSNKATQHFAIILRPSFEATREVSAKEKGIYGVNHSLDVWMDPDGPSCHRKFKCHLEDHLCVEGNPNLLEEIGWAWQVEFLRDLNVCDSGILKKSYEILVNHLNPVVLKENAKKNPWDSMGFEARQI